MAAPGSAAEAIKQKLDIVEFLKGYMTLTPAGRNFRGLCPFHKEKTPSFMVSIDRGTWHCFGCDSGGDIFEFLMKYENIEFAEALKILAEKAGIDLQRANPGEYRFAGLLYDINAAAADFYKKELAKAPVIREYLAHRGLTPATIEEFEIGWAPNDIESLNLHLVTVAKYRPEDVVAAGLAFKSDRGLQSDRFRGRIMFPIHNHVGKIVGFTGRIYPPLDTGTMGKYVNSPETPIFNKSKILYGFYKTKEHVRERASAVVVEGQMDFLMTYQAGVKNVVASSGTAFTPDHLIMLRRFADELVMNFDNDAAGSAAAEKAVDYAHNLDFSVRLITLPVGVKDAADAINENKEGFLKLVADAPPAIESYFERYLKKPPSAAQSDDSFSPRALVKNIKVVLEKIKRIPSPVERDHWISQTARYTGLDPTLIREEYANLQNNVPPPSSFERSSNQNKQASDDSASFRVDAPVPSRWHAVARDLLIHAHAFEKVSEIKKDFLPPEYASVYEALAQGHLNSSDAAVDQLLRRITMPVVEPREESWESLVAQLEQEYKQGQKKGLIKAVKQAERAGDDENLKKLLEEIARRKL